MKADSRSGIAAAPTLSSENPRFGALMRQLMELAGGNLAARTEPSTLLDDLDMVIVGINHLAAELETMVAANQATAAAAERKLRGVFAAFPDLLFLVHRDGRFLEVTYGTRDDLVVPPEHIVGRHIRELLPSDVAELCLDALVRAFRTQAIENIEYRLRVPNRGDRDFEARCLVIEDDQALVIVRDITDRKQAERAMAEAKRQAEAASEEKGRFLANMSHEMRTPLNGVIGMTDVLLATELSGEQRQHAEVIAGSARALLALINDVLDLSRLEADALVISREPVRLREFCDEILRMIALNAQEKGLRLSATYEVGLPERISIDPMRVRQVILNLLNNAIKFTNTGSVTLEIARGYPSSPATTPSSSPLKEALLLQVHDTGIGIAPEMCERIFGRFVQSDSSITRRYGGSGLGLAICKALVKKMGGEITVRSKPGEGSTFSVLLPFEPVSANSPSQLPSLPTAAPERPLRILVVEDNPVNRLVAMRLLKNAGHSVEAVEHGGLALPRLAEESFDVVLLDLQMPVMDGFETIRHIRERFGKKQVVIAVTADALSTERERCLAAGMDDYLSKPITAISLLTAIKRALAKHA